MSMFKKKSDKYVDLSERMRKQNERAESFKSTIPEPEEKKSESSSGGGFFSFFGGGSSASSVSSSDSSESPEERRKKLSKKLSDMTTKMEDLENQIYHLKQRIEVLERKERVGY